jgi:hypothetical protein
MSCLNFLSENQIDDATLSILTGTENAQFPLSNIKSAFTTKEFRSTGNTVEILVDLLSIQEIDSFAVTGHSLDGLGFTDMNIYGSASTDFSGSTAINIDTNDEHNFGFKLFTGVSFRFWKIEITGTGSFARLSNIFLGKKVDFTDTNKDNAKVRKNKYGQRYIDTVNRIKTIKGSLQHLNRNEYDMVNDLFTIHGVNKPLWMIVDPEGVSATDGQFMFSIYGYLRKVSAITMSGFGVYNAAVDMEQAG